MCCFFSPFYFITIAMIGRHGCHSLEIISLVNVEFLWSFHSGEVAVAIRDWPSEQ